MRQIGTTVLASVLCFTAMSAYAETASEQAAKALVKKAIVQIKKVGVDAACKDCIFAAASAFSSIWPSAKAIGVVSKTVLLADARAVRSACMASAGLAQVSPVKAAAAANRAA